MKLRKDSRIVRWAYFDTRVDTYVFPPDYRLVTLRSNLPPRIPNRTSLCVLFWRSVWMPAWIVCLCVLRIVMAAFNAWERLFGKHLRERQARRQARVWKQIEAGADLEPSAVKVLWLGFKAIKAKVCPLVELK